MRLRWKVSKEADLFLETIHGRTPYAGKETKVLQYWDDEKGWLDVEEVEE